MTLERKELATLLLVWKDSLARLSQEAVRRFNTRLQREWAIETGIIERIYTLDRGTTEALIEQGIESALMGPGSTDRDPKLVANIIGDQQEAVAWLFDVVTGKRPFGLGFIKELHALMTRHQDVSEARNTFGRQLQIPLPHGEFKRMPNNPTRPDESIHEYCPPEHVDSEMQALVTWHADHESRHVPSEVEAAWLHHRFAQIHPFQDGNGRVARALASMVFIKAGGFPLVVDRDDKTYILALEEADAGNLSRLVDLFTAIQRRSFLSASSIAEAVTSGERVGQIIEATARQLQVRQAAVNQEWEKAKGLARTLRDLAIQEFHSVEEKLKAELHTVLPHARFRVDEQSEAGVKSYWFRKQVIETARTLHYFASGIASQAWVRLVLQTESQADILLSIHVMGHEFRGVLAASLCFFRRSYVGPEEREIIDLQTACDEAFQVNYLEALEDARPRFERWLNRGMTKALGIWRGTL